MMNDFWWVPYGRINSFLCLTLFSLVQSRIDNLVFILIVPTLDLTIFRVGL